MLKLVLRLFVILPIAAFAASPCTHSDKPVDGVLVGWMTHAMSVSQGGADPKGRAAPFRIVARIRDGAIAEDDGSTLAAGQPYWNATSPADEPARLNAAQGFWYTSGRDHCVFSADLDDPQPALWTLLTSKPMGKEFRNPTATEKDRFEGPQVQCTVQGDPPAGSNPPCVRPRVLAVSDLNHDGRPEFWVTQLYRWDTGLVVWEDGKLQPLLRACPGCAD